VTADGSDFYKINPKGNVPALVLEDGTLLNEGAATLQWIADHAVEGSNLAPANGTTGRYVLQVRRRCARGRRASTGGRASAGGCASAGGHAQEHEHARARAHARAPATPGFASACARRRGRARARAR
jgi:glutathione S-transferase